MENNLAKHIARKTLIKNKYYFLKSSADLQRVIESNQFTVIEYKKYVDSGPMYELIKRLRIENEIEQTDSFLYINNSLKFLFINSALSDEDKCSLLRHELGHICDPSFRNSDAQNSKIRKEEFANEFSCYIKEPGIGFIIYLFFIKKWKWLVSIIALIICALGLLYMVNTSIAPSEPAVVYTSRSVISDSKYYVTSAGKKYHRKHCIIIKYKNNLTEITLNKAINDGYKPCLICNPEV